jgi:hypothetical protein
MILTNGCSFTEGYDLPDKSLAWPSQLGTLLNQSIKNLALGGSSNDRIVRTMKEELFQLNPSLVVIGWTTNDRNELHHSQGFYVRATGHGCIPECEQVPEDINILHNNWAKYNLNSWVNYRNWIYNVLFFQTLFEKLKIPYIFFTALGDNYINEFINQTDKSLFLADTSYQWRDRTKYLPERTIHKEWKELVTLCQQINLNHWALQNKVTMHQYLSNYPKDATGHPLGDGHEVWARVLAKHLQ